MNRHSHEYWMHKALELAWSAYEVDEVPIGALIVLDDQIIGEGYNRTIVNCDPNAHAEIIAIRAAAATIRNHRLPNARMYVTMEPCAMCAGAVIQARLDELIFAVPDPKAGAAGSVLDVLQHESLNHQCKVIRGVLESECAEIVQRFFRSKRV